MNEDFVTSELAKKLKEKGFDEACYTFYEYNSKEFYREERIPCCNSCSDDYAAPTISQVLKWLRKDKNIHITIDVDINDNFDFYFTILKRGEESWESLQYGESYETYEKAALAGIEYIIDKLI